MKLLNLDLIEITETHYLFTITVETSSFWGIKKTQTIDCHREIKNGQSRFTSTGDTLYNTWFHIDSSINAILSSSSKTYKLY